LAGGCRLENGKIPTGHTKLTPAITEPRTSEVMAMDRGPVPIEADRTELKTRVYNGPASSGVCFLGRCRMHLTN